MAKWLLVDGYNMAFRAFYGMPELTRADGFPTGALHGWVKTMWRLQDQEKPDAMVVFFDLGGSQDRLALHPEYKAQRKETPEPLEKQIPVIKELTRAMGLVGVELDGVESDDLVAAQARTLAADGHEVLIVSADKDFAQCVDDRIKILLPPPTANPKLGWRVLDAAGVREKFGVPPEQIAEYLALIGDTSDNIPGINGVGPKTAAKWFEEFKSLEGIIAGAAGLKPDRFREAVAQNADRLRLNLKLTTLSGRSPLPAVPRGEPQPAKLLPLLVAMEMKSTLAEAEKRYTGQTELF
ncbi:DNA polymerase I, thermostable [Lacunisphaera limnophila]|uniref:DNA polymerase I, thermostable n=1 Tax=Lacunisphaera limnophila TaxID=1838286 RepID=A0A1D8AXF7_9BACT|nr:5'-3' exonuclease H3TH domain-containing protein [Lacunisphaera limnophila]AOS45566.1 DNA polymerase I, thermostable [Lacunisphaera limnophila]